MSIKVEKLSKYYGQQAAVKKISFEIKTGEVVGFLGPNGAGKSTTLKMITTYLTPNSGKIFVNGINAEDDPIAVRKKIGYLPEQNPLYQDMNVIDYLKYTAELQSVPKDKIKDSVKKMVRVCGLEDVRHKDIGELSKGFKQRVGLAQAMIHNPAVLLLDEPTSGLDPNQIIEIRKLIKDLGKEKTLMLSTHILQEVQATCDRVIIINNGEIVADGTTDSLQKRFQGQINIYLIVKKDPRYGREKVISSFESVKNVEKVKLEGDNENAWQLDITANKGVDVREEIFMKAISLNMVLLEMHQEETSLEDIFRKLTT
ncbi:MAG: ATP-binding cassette domain-containing protein [Ignavibacteriae bacterium]|jgi:ABC-2 type transport system ATP-binding protein|nr:ATP-binding cassette domain-containing protein [Ignavibacteriota bacterium]